jgi:hypothetical protein
MGGLFDPKNPLASPLYGGGMVNALGGASTLLGHAPEATKRKVFFSFHYDDIMRVNNVRNAWKIDHPDNALMRSFYDSSLWESRKTEGDESVKRLIREGVEYTSAVCVLIGAQTWARQWVRYEIARAVIDKRGLLAVHLNNLNYHQIRARHPLGFNPLHLLGIYQSPTGSFYLYEKRQVVRNLLTGEAAWEWHEYQDHKSPVSLPQYLAAPGVGYVRPLSEGASEYDFVQNEGHKNLGAWVDQAAQRVGR